MIHQATMPPAMRLSPKPVHAVCFAFMATMLAVTEALERTTP